MSVSEFANQQGARALSNPRVIEKLDARGLDRLREADDTGGDESPVGVNLTPRRGGLLLSKGFVPFLHFVSP